MSDDRPGERSANRREDHPVERYLAAYLEAVEQGTEPPNLDGLDDADRAEAEAALRLLTGHPDDPGGPGDPGSPGDQAPSATAGDVGSDRTERSTNDADTVQLRPLAESSFAVGHGLIRSAPDVVVVGPAVRQSRQAAGYTAADIAREMARRGFTTDTEVVEELERHPTYRMRPSEARLLAAILDLPLATIEASAEPWPAEADELESLREALPARALVVAGDDVVVRTEAGDHLGVLRCPGDAATLDSRTFRLAAARLLNTRWSQLSGALLVSRLPPHVAIAVDALDCVTRAHAPTGLSGYSRLAEPEAVGDALTSYDQAHSVLWSDPEPLDDAPVGSDQERAGPFQTDDLTERLARIGERLSEEARRARQTGKRAGYQAATRWLAAAGGATVTALLDDLATFSPEEAYDRLCELVGS